MTNAAKLNLVKPDLIVYLAKHHKTLVRDHLKEFRQYYNGVKIFGNKEVLIEKMYDFTMERDELETALSRRIENYEYEYIVQTLKPLVLEKLGIMGQAECALCSKKGEKLEMEMGNGGSYMHKECQERINEE